MEKNAKEIKEYVEVLYKSTGRKVVMLGHSKGGVDAAAACSMFWDQLKGKVVGIILVQSPYGGSPIASDILREGQIADVETRRILEILICRIFKVNFSSIPESYGLDENLNQATSECMLSYVLANLSILF